MGNKIQRGLGALLAALLLASAVGCQTREPVPAPTPGPTLAPEPTPKAKPLTNAEKTRQEGEAVIAGLMKKSLTYQPMRDPEDQFNLHRVKNVHMIGMVTGEYSENRTASQYGVGGTDLGLSVNKGEETFFFFGDTFKNEDQTEHWRPGTGLRWGFWSSLCHRFSFPAAALWPPRCCWRSCGQR